MTLPYYTTSTLDNGLRIVSIPTDGQVAYIGVAIDAGSRDEPDTAHGLAHFVEHTIFKGTTSRKSYQIASRMERVGGELNAYTSKEETLVYTNAPAGYAERAVELLSDLVKHSVFPPSELNKEREVVIEEIHSYLDSPSDSVFDDFELKAYSGSALAHNILGTPESVRMLTSEDCRNFIRNNYTPENMVVYFCDPSPPSRCERLVEKYFGDMCFKRNRRERVRPGNVALFSETRAGDNHQANTILGSRLFGRTDERRFALFLLNNHLGGPCMNSRLNQELRDRRGLVYTVDSYVSLLSDTGLMTVYFGCDPSNVDKCAKLVRRELDRLAQNRISDRAFEAVKRQYSGQLTVSSDNRESRAMALAKSMLYYGELHDIEYSRRRIMEVTAEECREMAELVLSSGLSMLSLR